MLLAAGLLVKLAVAWAGPVCHIHPPATDPASALTTPPIAGPYASGEACEQANERLFAGQGRCHCASDWGATGVKPFLSPSPVMPEDPALNARPFY